MSNSTQVTSTDDVDTYTTPLWADIVTIGDDLKRSASAADNIIDCVTRGMGAIGELQWRAYADKKNLPDPDVAFSLGVFQSCLAELLLVLGRLHSDATCFAKVEAAQQVLP